MSQKNNKKKSLGATLFEVLVYIALFGMVFTGIYMVFSAAVKYYYVAQSNVWVQQSALNAINELSRELAEGSLKSVVLYPHSPYPNYPQPHGIVFMSPRINSTPASTVSYRTDGKLYWQKYVCYYLGDDPQDSSKKVIFRKEIPVAPQDEPSSSSTYTTSYFAANPSLSASSKIVAHDIIDFDVYWLNHQYGTHTASNNTIYIYVKTQAQDTSLGKENIFATTSSINMGNP